MTLGSDKNIHPLRLKNCFSPNLLVGAVERILDYNPNPTKYALLCDPELVSFLFWALISSENDIIASNCFRNCPSWSKYKTKPKENKPKTLILEIFTNTKFTSTNIWRIVNGFIMCVCVILNPEPNFRSEIPWAFEQEVAICLLLYWEVFADAQIC